MTTPAQAARARQHLLALFHDDPNFVGISVIRRDNSVLLRLVSSEIAVPVPEIVEGTRIRVEIVKGDSEVS